MMKKFTNILWLLILGISLAVASCAGWRSKDRALEAQPKGPVVTLPSSLHGTTGGMQWWYEQPDGFGPYSGVSYVDAGCGHCHVSNCNACHADVTGTQPVVEPDFCIRCHGRINKEAKLKVSDVHFDAGMTCSNCHSSSEVHGDGNHYDSMFSPGAMETECQNCHTELSENAEHDRHGPDFHCDSCHLDTVITCYNCHFETLLKEDKKKASAAFKGYIILLNDDHGKVRAGTYQSVAYEDKTFVAFGPYHGHAVTGKGRTCKDCHDGERMLELSETDRVVMTRWDADKGRVTHTTGVIPFVPDKFEFQFVTLHGQAWTPLTKEVGQMQYKFCTPLTTEQLKLLGASQ